MQHYHVPALLEPVMEAMSIRSDGVYADATFGGGGHSRALLSRLGPQGRLIGFDRDAEALANAPADPRLTMVRGNFAYMENFVDWLGCGSLDGIMADLGVSFHHFDDASRGFSFRADSPLDMRMNQAAPFTAAELVATYSAAQLTGLLRAYTDLKRPDRIAQAIVAARTAAPLLTTGQLAAALEGVLPAQRLKKDMAQVFQALRIEVNGEMQALSSLLQSAGRILKPGGRLVILTYHSIEDRMVKNFFRSGDASGTAAQPERDFYGNNLSPWRELWRKPQVAPPEEVEANPRSRSAKLRAAELLPAN